MRPSYYFFLILYTYLLATPSKAAQIVTRVDFENKSVELKCYDESLVFANGVYFERKSKSGWVRLHSHVIKHGDYRITNEDLNKDSVLAEMVNFIPVGTRVNSTGAVLLNLLVKSFQSTAFSKYLGIYYQDTTLVENETYVYRVIDASTEKEIAQSDKVTIVPNSLGAPKNVEVKQKGKNIFIGWTPETELYYATDIYRKTPLMKDYKKVNEFPIMATLDSNDQASQYFFNERLNNIRGTVYYKVVSLGFFGDTSRFTKPIAIHVNTKNPPSAVGHFKMDTIVNTDISFSWTPPDDTTIVGYQLYEKLSQKSLPSPVISVLLNSKSTSYLYKNVIPGDHYFYLASVNSYAEETKSATTLVRVEDMMPPSPPTNLVVKEDSGKVHFTWQHPNPEPKMGYQFFRSITTKDGDFSLMNATPVTTNEYTDVIDLRTSSPFYYKMVAVDSAWNKSTFSNMVKAQLPDRTAPSVPVVKFVKVVNNNIRIEWIKNAEIDLQHYILKKQNDKGEVSFLQTIDNFYIDRDFSAATQWIYSIQAKDSSDNLSSWSAPWKVIVPTKQQTETEALILKVKHKKGSYKLKWDWLDGKKDIMGFIILGGKTLNLTPKSKLILQKKYTLESKNISIQIKAIGTNGESWVSNIYKPK